MSDYEVNNSELARTISTMTNLPPLRSRVTDIIQPVLIINPSGTAQTVTIDNPSDLDFGTLPKAKTTQTLVSVCAVNQNTGTTLYTVTAGKTFYCLGLVMTNTNAAIQRITADGTDVVSGICAINTTYTVSGNGIIFKALAGKNIVINATVNNNYVTMWGYEEWVKIWYKKLYLQ